MADIVVIGSFVMDMTAHVDRFPADGETMLANRASIACGGKGVNQAVAAKRLGASVEMVGMIGTDAYGDSFWELLREERIEHTNVLRTPEAPTGMAQIQINAEGQNRIIVIPGANEKFGLKELDAADACLRQAKIVMVQFELDMQVARETLRRAKQYGATTILNPAPAKCVDCSILKYADYITPNEIELEMLAQMPTDTEEKALAAARHLHHAGVKNVIATLGNKGALIVNDTVEKVIPQFMVNAVDTVAAGDSFNGALAVKLLENCEITETVRFANAEGALTVTKCGAIPSLHTRAEVETFLVQALN